MSTHNISFHGEIRKIFTGYPPLTRPIIYIRYKKLYVLCWPHITDFISSRSVFQQTYSKNKTGTKQLQVHK